MSVATLWNSGPEADSSRVTAFADLRETGRFKRMEAQPLVLRTKREQMLYGCYTEALRGNWRAQLQLKKEALSTADFPGFFQRVNNAVMQGSLATYEPTWQRVAKRLVADNLREQREMRLDVVNTGLPRTGGGTTRLAASLPRIPELTPFPTIGFTASGAGYRTAKTGVRVDFSWEAFREDEWGQIRNFPDQMRTLAENTIETEAWSQYIISTGFNPAMFPSSHNLAGNPALTLGSLGNAIVQASKPPATPADQRPRINPQTRWGLLVPPNLTMTAEAILGARDIEFTDANNTKYRTDNVVRGKVEVVEMGWWDTLSASPTYDTTAWAIVPLNGQGPYGTTAANVFLNGADVPELRIKNDAGSLLGGGELSPYEGSFENDSIQIRLRFFVAGATLGNDNTVWSKGTGAANTDPTV